MILSNQNVYFCCFRIVESFQVIIFRKIHSLGLYWYVFCYQDIRHLIIITSILWLYWKIYLNGILLLGVVQGHQVVVCLNSIYVECSYQTLRTKRVWAAWGSCAVLQSLIKSYIYFWKIRRLIKSYILLEVLYFVDRSYICLTGLIFFDKSYFYVIFCLCPIS